jgi:hypothetical protein
MAFTNITKPAVGDPTKKTAFADAVIDDLTFLYNQFLSVVGSREIVINGSFESDADADGIPDGWTRTLQTGGVFLHDTSTSAADGKSSHGKRSVKFTSDGVGGHGGGDVTTTDFMECTNAKILGVLWQMKSTAANAGNKVTVFFYDSTQAAISNTDIYSSTANPTAWSVMASMTAVPANARYMKLKFTGCDSALSTVVASTWFDDIRVFVPQYALERRMDFFSAGSFTWRCPASVQRVFALVVGAGGSGGGGTGLAGAGGGAGGSAYGFLSVTPGTDYTITVGAGGTGSTGAGVAGTASSFSSMTGNGGGGGAITNGAGGAGGTASGGQYNQSGTAGDSRTDATHGGNGGLSYYFSLHGIGGQGASPLPTSGGRYGGGGGGAGSFNPTNGGAGADGAVILLVGDLS